MKRSKVQNAVVVVASVGAIFAASSACSDPVKDAQIAALGGEDPAVPPGPDHRPGQPCLVCHSPGGPAEDSPFAVAGTIYLTDQPGSKGADRIFIQFTSDRPAPPDFVPQSYPSGNFFIPASEWPRIAFPLRVALYRDVKGAPVQTMKSLVGREGSCNFCHKPNFSGNLSDQDKDALKSEAGQIYLTSGGGT